MQRKKVALVGLVTFCLVTSIFAVNPTRSQYGATSDGEANPWVDINDDGVIDIFDLVAIALAFGSDAPAINKTELLLQANDTYTRLMVTFTDLNQTVSDLKISNSTIWDKIHEIQTDLALVNSSLTGRLNTLAENVTTLHVEDLILHARIDSLNSSINQQINILKTQILSLNATDIMLSQRMDELEAQLAILNATNYNLQSQIDALNANVTYLNNWVTSLNATSRPIMLNMTYNVTTSSTTETFNWVDMAGMSLTVTLNTTSHLLIVFSADAWINDNAAQIRIQALCGTNQTKPGDIYLTPTLSWGYGNYHVIGSCAYTYVFYLTSVPAGTQTIKMQWRVTGATGSVGNRTLTVLAFPSP